MNTKEYIWKNQLDALQRTSLLFDKSRKHSKSVIDFLFLLYIDEKIVYESSESGDIIKTIFEKTSLTTVLTKFFNKELQNVILDDEKILDESDWIKFTKLFSKTFPTYIREKGIDHNFLSLHNINNSPLGYGAELFIQQELGYNNRQLPKDIGTSFYSIWHTFFSSYFPEKLFEKKSETKTKKIELKRILEIKSKMHKALEVIFLHITNTFDIEKMIFYIQHMYAILSMPSKIPLEKYNEFSLFIFDIENLSLKEEGGKSTSDIYLKTLSDFFRDIVPDEQVTCASVLGDIKIVHKNNFVVTDMLIDVQHDEVSMITSELYKGSIGNDTIKNARIYDNKGFEVMEGDFRLQKNWGSIRWPYYVLTEHDGFWDAGKAIVKDISSTPYRKSFALDPYYIRMVAKYKIEDGCLIKNTFLENNVFCFLDIII